MTSDDQRATPNRSRADKPDLDTLHRRLPVLGAATAFELSGQHFGQMHSLRQIAFTDVGLEADSDDGIPCGIAVTVGFQAEEHSARRGRVTACEQREEIYHIAVAIEPGALLGC